MRGYEQYYKIKFIIDGKEIEFDTILARSKNDAIKKLKNKYANFKVFKVNSIKILRVNSFRSIFNNIGVKINSHDNWFNMLNKLANRWDEL